jgi:hypothetical protein
MLVLDPKAGAVRSVAFDPTGRRLAVVAKQAGGLVVWDEFLSDGPRRILPGGGPLGGRARFSADGHRVGCQAADWHPVVYDLARGRAVGSDRYADLVTGGEMTPAGDSTVMVVNMRPWVTPPVDTYRLTCRPVEPSPRNPTRWAIVSARGCLGEFAFPGGGTEVVSIEVVVGGPGPLRFVRRDLTTGTVLAASAGFAHGVRSPCAGPDARVAAIRTNALVGWSGKDGDPVGTWENATPRQFTDVAFHPAAAVLAATNLDPTVRVYDAATGAVVRTYDWQVGKLRCVAFSPDGLLAAAGSESGKVVVWDVDL